MNVSKGRTWGVIAFLVTGTGVAGYKQTDGIGESSTKKSAWGALGATHNLSNDSTSLGCQVVGEQGKAVTATCAVKTNSTTSLSCVVPSFLLPGLRTISGESWEVLYDNDMNGTCDGLEADSSSFRQPKSSGSVTTSKLPVTLSSDKNFATGAIGTVYNATDNNQYLGCKVTATLNSSLVRCTAKTNDNPPRTFDCSSSDSSIVEAERAIKDDSYLEITRNGATCTKLLVKNDSRYAPRR